MKKYENLFNQEIEFHGFVDNIRNLQYVQFLIVRNEVIKLQVTIEKNEENKELNEIISNLSVESTVIIYGKLMENPKVKLNGMELIPKSIVITSKNLEDLPINFNDPDTINLDTRLDYRFLDLRSEKNLLLFKIKSAFIKALRNYLENNDYTEIHTPKLIKTASESGSSVFEVNYYDDKAYLAQSPQFYKQMAMSAGFGKVFEIAPVFRAEKSYTSRHATEITMFDLEKSYINSYEDIMEIKESMFVYALKEIKEKYGSDIKKVFDTEVIIPKTPFPRIKLKDLYKVLNEKYNYTIPGEDDGDLNAEGERLAGQYAMEEYDSEFIFITDYSAKKRAFYHMRKDGVPQGFDLIWKGVEITTGAQREHRYEELKSQAKEAGLDKDVEFYLDFFKHGCPPHGGFGMGVDRITMILLNISTVKETMFIFRGPNRLSP